MKSGLFIVNRESALRTCGRAQSQGFGDVADGLDAAVSDDRDAKPPGVLRNLIDGGGLGSAACQH